MSKYCPKCGSVLDSRTGLCPNCSPAQNNPPAARQKNKTERKPAAPKNKSSKSSSPRFLNKVIITACVCVAFCVVLVVLAALDIISVPAIGGCVSSYEVTKEEETVSASEYVDPNNVEKPDFVDPDGMSDEEIQESVDELLEPVDADEYFDEIGTVKEKTEVYDSEDIMSEKDVFKDMKDRGFEDYRIIAEYDMDGEYTPADVVSSGSYSEHPVYSLTYLDSSDRQWTVYSTNGLVYAMLFSYAVENPEQPLVIVSETKTLMGYDSESNTFYEYVPSEDKVQLDTVNKVTAEALDDFEI